MAYCRFMFADAYVFMHANGFLECCGCSLGETWEFGSTQDMVDHLNQHIAAGHNIPDDVIPALWADDKENFPDGAA